MPRITRTYSPALVGPIWCGPKTNLLGSANGGTLEGPGTSSLALGDIKVPGGGLWKVPADVSGDQHTNLGHQDHPTVLRTNT